MKTKLKSTWSCVCKYAGLAGIWLAQIIVGLLWLVALILTTAVGLAALGIGIAVFGIGVVATLLFAIGKQLWIWVINVGQKFKTWLQPTV